MKLLLRPVILGTWSPPVLACVRSWGRRGWPVGLIVVQPEGEIPPASRYVTAWRRLEPGRLHTAQGLRLIRDFLKCFRADGIACIDEAVALWLGRETVGEPLSAALWFPDPVRLQRVLDKGLQIEAARRSGLSLLPTVTIEPPGTQVPSIPKGFYPLCLRPAAGGVEPPFKVRVVPDQDALEHFVSALERLSKPLIAQPYRHLPNLVVHGARSAAGEVMGLQAFWVPRKFEGVTLVIQPVSLPHSVETGCRAFLDDLDVVGPFHFEFLWEPEKETAWFLEINNRLGGTTAKVLACGYDEPVYLLRAFGANVPRACENGSGLQGTASSRQALLKYLAYTVTGRLTPLDYPHESTASRVAEALHGLWAYRDDVAAADDFRGGVNLYWANVRSKLKSFFKQSRNRVPMG